MTQYTNQSLFQTYPGATGLAVCEKFKLFKYPWLGQVIDEPVYLEGTAEQTVDLWRKPASIDSVRHHPSGQALNGPAYVPGVDWVLTGDGRFCVPACSGMVRAPAGFVTTVDPQSQYAADAQTHAGTPLRLEVDYPLFHSSVTYTPVEPMLPPGVEPFGGPAASIGGGYPWHITFAGDSVTQGGGLNSLSLNRQPMQPNWPALAMAMLCSGPVAGGNMFWRNKAVSGRTTLTGWQNVQELNDTQSDEFVFMYGPNDAGAQYSGQQYKDYLRGSILLAYGNNPAACVTLVVPISSNPIWKHSWPKFHAYRDAIYELAGEFKAQGKQIRVANPLNIWEEMCRRKCYASLTSNGVNHPEDFVLRLIAQVYVWLQFGYQL